MISALFTVWNGPYALLARISAYGLLAVSLMGYGWFKGNEHGTEKLISYQQKEAADGTRIAAARTVVTTKG